MRIVLSVLMMAFLVGDWSGEPHLPVFGPHPTMRVERVDLYPDNPGRKDLGALTYLGGIRMIGDSEAFGGFSSMSVVGDRFTLLSDGGNFVSFRLDSNWNATEKRFGALPGGPGTGFLKQDRDSESMARDPVSGDLWVGFERANAIWRYSADFGRIKASVAPAAMASWPENTGAESMVRLRSGRFLILAEASIRGAPGLRQAVMSAGDPTRDPRAGFTFRYRPPPRKLTPTDIEELPDGRLLVLNRGIFLPLNIITAVTIVDPKQIRPGATVSGREIARFTAPALHDNYEALAITQEAGRTIVWIASDDNQLPIQQSLLLKFALATPPPGKR